MSLKGKKFLISLLTGISLAIGSFPENGLSQESYPTKPITMIIDMLPGGQKDTMTRAICKAAEKDLGQPIICENKPGAGGAMGKTYVVKSKPDGYTIGVATTATNINVPHMQKVPYDPLTDLTEIMVFMKYTHGLIVKADGRWNSFGEVLAYARNNPWKFTIGIAGIGVTEHIVLERIAMKEGIKWSFVPFKSGAEVLLATLGGHVNSGGLGPADSVQQITAGQLKLILALNNVGWPIAPNAPTVLEKYGFWGMSFTSVYGPKGLPESVRERLQNAFKKAMDDPSFVETAKSLDVVTFYMSGKDYDKLWRSHYDEMGKIIRDLGLGKK